MKLLRVELIQLHTHGHAIDTLHVGLLESVLGHQSLSRVLLLEQLLLLPHCGHRLWVVELLLQLLLLLLEHLLLSGIQVLQSMSIWVRTRRHAAHEGRVYLSSGSGHCHGAAELMRHTASRSALLTRVMRHAGGHGMPGDAWVSHTGGMP